MRDSKGRDSRSATLVLAGDEMLIVRARGHGTETLLRQGRLDLAFSRSGGLSVELSACDGQQVTVTFCGCERASCDAVIRWLELG